MDEARFSYLLDGLYAAATAPERLPSALHELGDQFDCANTSLIDRDARTCHGRAICVGSIDEAGQRAFFTEWRDRNVLIQRTPGWRIGTIETDRQLLDKAEFLRSDYYNGFLRLHDSHAVMRLTFDLVPGSVHVLNLVRSRRAGEFEPVDVAALRLFAPHVQRASRIARRIEAAETALRATHDLIEHELTAVVLLDRQGRIAFANRAARMLAGTGDAFLLSGERIVARDQVADTRLQQLIRGATGRIMDARAVRGGAITLVRAEGAGELHALVGPLAVEERGDDRRPVAFILITDPATMADRPERMLAQLFGLTPAERRLAARLLAGDSPEEAARALDVRLSTARWHLASLYRKTDTGRQSELLRLLLSLPAVRDDPAGPGRLQ